MVLFRLTYFFTARAMLSAVLGVVILSVCPSVRLSDTPVLCDLCKEPTCDIFIPHKMAIILVF